jgi:transcriptional regulator with XRE-family HTH domain
MAMLLHQELRKAREELGITQAELAKRAGIPRNQIVRAEKGENITLDTLRTIVAHLPVESLTLLEKVKLSTDVVPQAEKVHFATSKALIAMTTAFQAALAAAMESHAALAAARAADPHPGGFLDDQLLMRSMKSSLDDLHEKLADLKIA